MSRTFPLLWVHGCDRTIAFTGCIACVPFDFIYLFFFYFANDPSSLSTLISPWLNHCLPLVVLFLDCVERICGHQNITIPSIEHFSFAIMPFKALPLNNGAKIPFMGLGTWDIRNATSVVEAALDSGYRMIDTAVLYGNERECGQGILNWLQKDPVHHKRKDVFYITKLWNDQNGYSNAKNAIHECLNKVSGLEYIDLLLIHSPTEGKRLRLETYKAMQEAVESGIVKSIGVSNYGEGHIDELLSWDGLRVKPVVNEIEVSPWCMRQELCDFTKSRGLQVIAYAPLSHAYRINDPDAVSLAKKKGVSSAQILIRWSIQKGYIPIPKTKTISRLAQNLDVLSFELSQAEMAQLDHPEVHDPSDWDVVHCP